MDRVADVEAGATFDEHFHHVQMTGRDGLVQGPSVGVRARRIESIGIFAGGRGQTPPATSA